MLYALFSKPWWKSQNQSELSSGELARQKAATQEQEPVDDDRAEELLSDTARRSRDSLEGRPSVAIELGDSAAAEVEAEEQEEDVEEELEAESVPGAEQGTDEGFQHEDPHAPGFDLDDGEPLLPRHSGRRSGEELPWRSDVPSAKDFFGTEVLYRFDIIPPELRELLAGTYRIELKGYKGGVWSMNIGKDLVVVNRREEAEVVISMQHNDFISIVNGELNPQLAILAQRARFSGDVRKVVALQSLLAPDAS